MEINIQGPDEFEENRTSQHNELFKRVGGNEVDKKRKWEPPDKTFHENIVHDSSTTDLASQKRRETDDRTIIWIRIRSDDNNNSHNLIIKLC